jgi:hypothetical protein
MRTVAQLSGYLATHDDDGVQLQQYAGGALAVALADGGVELQLTTDYPWERQVEVEVLRAPDADWSLDLRVPAWCEDASATVHPAGAASEDTVGGSPGTYLRLRRRWTAGDRVALELPLEVRITRPDERIDAVRGCAAVERGPLVYCFEDHDQPEGVSVDEIVLTGENAAVDWRPELLGGVAVVQIDGGSLTDGDGALPDGAAPLPYRPAGASSPFRAARLTAIPYHAWANRGVRAMRVWVPFREDGVR